MGEEGDLENLQKWLQLVTVKGGVNSCWGNDFYFPGQNIKTQKWINFNSILENLKRPKLLENLFHLETMKLNNFSLFVFNSPENLQKSFSDKGSGQTNRT